MVSIDARGLGAEDMAGPAAEEVAAVTPDTSQEKPTDYERGAKIIGKMKGFFNRGTAFVADKVAQLPKRIAAFGEKVGTKAEKLEGVAAQAASQGIDFIKRDAAQTGTDIVSGIGRGSRLAEETVNLGKAGVDRVTKLNEATNERIHQAGYSLGEALMANYTRTRTQMEVMKNSISDAAKLDCLRQFNDMLDRKENLTKDELAVVHAQELQELKDRQAKEEDFRQMNEPYREQLLQGRETVRAEIRRRQALREGLQSQAA